jgi:hypothetical protein
MQRTETIVAVFDTAMAADAAVQDLEVARIPSAVVQQSSGTPGQHVALCSASCDRDRG